MLIVRTHRHTLRALLSFQYSPIYQSIVGETQLSIKLKSASVQCKDNNKYSKPCVLVFVLLSDHLNNLSSPQLNSNTEPGGAQNTTT